jgi:hypothetical protein
MPGLEEKWERGYTAAHEKRFGRPHRRSLFVGL